MKNQVNSEEKKEEGGETEKWFDVEDLKLKLDGIDPPCIKKLLKGIEGAAIRPTLAILSSYLVNFKGMDPQKALRVIKNWNKLNSPRLENEDLEIAFAKAIRGNYVYVCRDDLLIKECDRNNCPLKQERNRETRKEKRFDPEIEKKIKEEVKRVFEADNQLKALEPHLDELIVEEHNNKKTVFVLLTGSRYGTNDKLSIIILKGESRSGKTTIANATTKGFKTKRVGRFTKHALDYSELGPFEVIYIQELGWMDIDNLGLSTLRLMDAGDEGYTVECSVRDEETGRIRTEQHKVPAKCVISTTTRLALEHQLENRGWSITCDDSPETTAKIIRWKAQKRKQEDEKLLGRRKITDYEVSKEVLSRFTSLIKPHKIIVPFRHTIGKMFKLGNSRIRGDVDKIYKFIELYANLNIKRLEKLKNVNEVYAVTSEVAIEALEIIKGTISQMLSGIEPRTKQVLEALNSIEVDGGFTDPHFTGEESRPIKIHPNIEGFQINKGIREQIAKKLNVSDDTVRARLNVLCRSKYLSSDEGRGRKGKEFTLLYDVDEILRKLKEEAGFSNSPRSLKDEMEKEAQEFLNPECKIKESENEIAGKTKYEEKPLEVSDGIPHSNVAKEQQCQAEISKKNAENNETRFTHEYLPNKQKALKSQDMNCEIKTLENTKDNYEKKQTSDSESSNIHQGGSAFSIGKDPYIRRDGSDSRDVIHENLKEMTFLEAMGGPLRARLFAPIL